MHGYEGPATIPAQGADSKSRPWGLTLGALGIGGRSVLLTLRAEEKVFRIVFDRGIVIAASSPVTADSVGRIALMSRLITPAQVDEVKRRLAAPGADEVDVLATVAQLPADQVRLLRRRLIVQRAARTFSVEQGAYELDERAPLPVMGLDIGVDVRTVIYAGARANLSELRLALELRQLGRRFALKPDAIPDLRRYGFTRAERPVLEALRRGTSLAELQENQRDLDPRIAQAVIYALASCDALIVADNIARGSGAMPPIRVEVEPPQSLASLLPRAASPVLRDVEPPRPAAQPEPPRPPAADPAAPEVVVQASSGSSASVRLQPQTALVSATERAKARTVHARAKTRTMQPRMAPARAKTRTAAPPPQAQRAPQLLKVLPSKVMPAQRPPEPQAYPVSAASAVPAAPSPVSATSATPSPVTPAAPVAQPIRPSALAALQPQPPKLPAGMRPMPPTVPLQPQRVATPRARTLGKHSPIPPRAPAPPSPVPARAAATPPPIPARTAATPPPIPTRAAAAPPPVPARAAAVPVPVSHAPTEPALAPISHAPTAPVSVPEAVESRSWSDSVPVPVTNDFSPAPRSMFDTFRTNLTTHVRPNALAVREVATLIEERTALLDRGADHFKLLGVAFGASVEEVHAAYVELSRHLRPARLTELGIDDESFAAQRLLAQLGIAFTVLTDRVLRTEYIAALRGAGRPTGPGRG